MNRHDRRAAASKVRRTKLDRVTAVHEAGHAVARVLTADAMGFSAEEAVICIKMGATAEPHGVSADDRSYLVSAARTDGPRFSAEIDQHANPEHPERLEQTLAAAKQAGADIHAWLEANSLFTVFASVAEAKFLGVPSLDVWLSPGSEDDRSTLDLNARLAGLDDDATEVLKTRTLARAAELVERPDVWRAVLAVADNLPTRGRIEGAEIARIVAEAIAEPIGG